MSDQENQRAALLHEWEFTKNVIISANGFLLTLLSCCRLPPTDFGGCLKCCRSAQSDTYCKLSLLTNGRPTWTARTIVISDDDNPGFNQQFHLSCADIRHDVLRIEVWDEDVFRDDRIGFVNINIWDALHLVRDPAAVETMGIDNASLKIQYLLEPFPGQKRLLDEYRSTVYIAFKARATDQHVQRARMLTARGVRNGQSMASDSLASSSESVGDDAARQQSVAFAPVMPKTPKTRPGGHSNKIRPQTPMELAARRIPDTVATGSHTAARFRAEFRRFDLDHNGSISANEMRTICERALATGLINDPLHAEDVLGRVGAAVTFPEYERLVAELTDPKYLPRASTGAS